MTTPHYRLAAGVGAVVLMGLCETARAADGKPGGPAVDVSGGSTPAAALDFHSTQRTWQAEIEPMVWFAAFNGDITFKGGSKVQVDEIGMDEVHVAPAGRFTLRSDRWTFAFTGWATSFDDESTAETDIDAGVFEIARGDRVAFDFDYASFKLTGGYAFDPVVRDDENGTALWFDLYGGVQVYYLDLKFGPANGDEQIEESGTWAAPLVGTRLNFRLPHGFEIGVSLDAGAAIGEGTGFAWDVVPHFRWFPMENKTVAVEVGFRNNPADLSKGGDDDFEFDGFAAGLFASVVIRF
jgi:hypothetical protein